MDQGTSQLLRVQNFCMSIDGFGAGEGQTLERPFGHANPADLFSWAGATASWPNRTDPGGSRGLDDYFTRDFSRNIGAEIMGRNTLTGSRQPRTLRPMCLLIVIHRVVPGMPLIVAANRDERRDRAAIPMTRLEGAGDELAILGGRDEVGGGTWLATNEAGVVAGLTNRPLRDGPDTAKRSRGELPLALTRHPTAAAAVEAFGAAIDPSAFNPSWLLVADRHDVFFVDVTGTDRVVVEHLRPGVHVLENRTLHERSPKVERVGELLDPVLDRRPTVLLDRLRTLLADHHMPVDEPPADSKNPRLALAARAICVHADEDDYGTRSSAVITVAADPAPPTILWTDDSPCHDRWRASDHLWAPPALGEQPLQM